MAMTIQQFRILRELIAGNGDATAYDAFRSAGDVPIASAYRITKQFHDAGYLEVTARGASSTRSLDRVTYRVTHQGREEVEAFAATMRSDIERWDRIQEQRAAS